MAQEPNWMWVKRKGHGRALHIPCALAEAMHDLSMPTMNSIKVPDRDRPMPYGGIDIFKSPNQFHRGPFLSSGHSPLKVIVIRRFTGYILNECDR